MRRALVSVLVVVALAAAACGTKDPEPGEARLKLRAGSAASLKTGSKPWTDARDGALLRRGTRVRVTKGEGELRGSKGLVLRLRAGGELAMGVQAELTSGLLLVETTARPAVIGAAGSSFSVGPRSVARLERSLASTVSVYRGRADITSAARKLAVPSLRAAAVPGRGLVPLSPSPIRTNPSDPWDIRFLGAAFDLTAQLDAGSAGFSAQAATLDADALGLLVPGFPAGVTSGALTARLPGEQLVGAAIAASDRAAAGGVAQRLASVLSFRDDGATWGLVVLDQAGADQEQVLALVREAIGRWAAQAGGLTAAPFLAPRPGASATGTPPSTPASSSPGQPGVTPPTSPPTTVVGPLPVPVPPTVPPAVPPAVPPVVPDPLPIPPTGTPADNVINAIGDLAHLPALPVTPPSLP